MDSQASGGQWHSVRQHQQHGTGSDGHLSEICSPYAVISATSIKGPVASGCVNCGDAHSKEAPVDIGLGAHECRQRALSGWTTEQCRESTSLLQHVSRRLKPYRAKKTIVTRYPKILVAH